MQHIIEQKKALLARETFSRRPINYGEGMSADEKDRYIQYLVGRLEEAELDKRAMELGVKEFQATFDSVNAGLSALRKEMDILQVELRKERGRRKQAEARARKLDQQLKFVRKNRFGDKRQKAEKVAIFFYEDGSKGREDKDEADRSPYLTEALNYPDKFRNGIFAFLKDGNYPIDNNISERTIRKLTTQRNSMLHFGSDEGVEMAATYHSVISTVKLHGMSVWNYLGEFFKKIFNGCRDFLSLTPANIGLTTS